MAHTKKHLLIATAWLFSCPVFIIIFATFGALPTGEFNNTLLSAVWGLGLVATFASWSFRDAPAHGKSVYFAVAFTVAWFFVFFLAALPYLFATRGARQGFFASLKYLAFCAACFAGFIFMPFVMRFFS